VLPDAQPSVKATERPFGKVHFQTEILIATKTTADNYWEIQQNDATA